MSEQLIEFISAMAGIFIVFGTMGIGCAIYELIITMFEDRKRKKVKTTELKKYCKWTK